MEKLNINRKVDERYRSNNSLPVIELEKWIKKQSYFLLFNNFFGSCSKKTNNELAKNNISILQDSLPVFIFNQDSLTIITPGKNGIDLPKSN